MSCPHDFPDEPKPVNAFRYPRWAIDWHIFLGRSQKNESYLIPN